MSAIEDLRNFVEKVEATAPGSNERHGVNELRSVTLMSGAADELEALTTERQQILREVCRLQPPGSPCPGGPAMLVAWIIHETQNKIADLTAENERLTVERDNAEGAFQDLADTDTLDMDRLAISRDQYIRRYEKLVAQLDKMVTALEAHAPNDPVLVEIRKKVQG